jgi:large subunit ribosomal protein L9
MEVIIIKPIKKIREIGAIVKVKDGYARNYLIPEGFALLATEENKNKFTKLKEELDVKYQAYHQEAIDNLALIDNQSITFISQSLEDGKLFGSINSKQIIKKVLDEYKIDLRNDQINLPHPIKSIGVYKVSITLHHDVIANMLVNVARTESEALTQINSFQVQVESAHKAEVADVAPPAA